MLELHLQIENVNFLYAAATTFVVAAAFTLRVISDVKFSLGADPREEHCPGILVAEFCRAQDIQRWDSLRQGGLRARVRWLSLLWAITALLALLA